MKILLLIFLFTPQVFAVSGLSYSGRLVNADGSGVAGPVDLRFELIYSGSPATIRCTKDLTNVTLSKGVFHLKVDYTNADCSGTALKTIIQNTPAAETLSIRVTDLTTPKVYSFQDVQMVPYAVASQTLLAPVGASAGDVLTWDGSQWKADTPGAGGTVTEVTAGVGLIGGPITTTGTLDVDVGVTAGKILQLDGSAKIPAVDGSLLTNIDPDNFNAVVPFAKGGTGLNALGGANTILGVNNAANALEYKALGVGAGEPLSITHSAGAVTLGVGTVPVDRGGTGVNAITGNRIVTTNALGTGFAPASCGVDEVLTFDVTGAFLCKSVASIVNGGIFKAAAGTAAAPSFTFSADEDTGLRSDGDNGMYIVSGGTDVGHMDKFATFDWNGTLSANYVYVDDGAEMFPAITFSSDNGMGFYKPAADTLGYSINGGERIRINSSGSIGIGTKNPLSLVHAHNEFGNATIHVSGNGGDGAITLQGGAFVKRAFFSANDTLATFGTNSEGGSMPLSIQTNGQNRIYVKTLGNVGIENTDPQYTLDVTGDINASGSVMAAGVALTSDRRFKKDINPLTDALEKVLRIRGVSYYWKKDDSVLQYGVIAQEVQKVYPGLVEEGKDGYLRVNYPGLIAPLIESTRTLHQEDQKLGRKIAHLEEENRKLREENEKMKKDLVLIRKKLGL